MKHCPKCHGLMPEGAMRCIRCGFELQAPSVPQPPAPAAAPVARPAGVSEPHAGAGERSAQRVGPKQLSIAVVVVAVMLSLAWLKESGSTYAGIAFTGLMLAALVSNLIILRRRKKADENGATRQSKQMPKQIRYAIGAVVVALVMDAALTPPLGFAIDVAINGLLLFLVAKRHNWARWTFVVLAGMAVLGSIPRLLAQFGSEPWSAALGTLDATLTALALILLLTRPAAQWCNKEHDKAKDAGASTARLNERRGATVHTSKDMLIVGAVLLGLILLVSEILWPTYRGFRRHSFASQAILAASALKPTIAERLLKREGGAPVNAGLRIEAQPPITGGYVAPDGTIVVEAELDFLVPFTLIVRPRLDSENAVEWTCGVAKEGQTRYVSTHCRRVLSLPDKR